jgi:hypothetical protein
VAPDLPDDAAALQALVALQATAPDAERARSALTAVTVALDQGRSVPTADATQALAGLADAGDEAALVPTSEQQVFAANRGSAATAVVGVQPRDAVTSLDHPLVRLDTPEREAGVSAAAVEGVVRLLEQQGRAAAVADGFRPPPPAGDPSASVPPTSVPPASSGAPSGTPSGTPSDPPAAPRVVPPPGAEDVERLLEQLEEVGRPSRVLAVLDAGASLRAVTPTGETRVQVLQEAATGSLGQFPDTASVGLWFFANDLGRDGADWVPVVPVRGLDEDVEGRSQRELLTEGVGTLPERLTPGGSGLYSTTLAAVRALRDSYDPGASNTVVVVTDGPDDAADGPTLQQLVNRLREEADPERPVRVVAIGLSGDVAADELTAIAEATGGAAYLAERPEDFEAVLLDALRRR